MGRRALGIGEHGQVTVKKNAAGFQVARCRVKDGDGKIRQVQARGRSISAARAALKIALAVRDVRYGTEEISSHMTLTELAEIVFSDLDGEVAIKAKSTQTLRRYRQAWNVHIKPRMGELQLHQITTRRCNKMLKEIRATSDSPSNAKVVKAAFNKIIEPACVDIKPALPSGNPMSMASDVPGKRGEKEIVTVPAEDVPKLLQKLRGNPRSVEREIDMMVLWMVCTGDRIGNMVAADWSYLDLVEGTGHLRGVGIEHNGRMSIEFESSKSNKRFIDLPYQLVTALQGLWLRRECPTKGFVFPGKNGNPRGLHHLHGCLREAFIDAGYPTLMPHSFRRTTATELERAGLSDFDIAAYLGHDDVETTRKNYLQKRQRSERRRVALDDLVGGITPGDNVRALHGASQSVGSIPSPTEGLA